MPKVQIRDAADHDKILVNTMDLPFVPELNKPLWILRRATDQPRDGVVLTSVIQYQIVTDQPDESGIVFAGRRIDG